MKKLIINLIREGTLRTPEIVDAFLEVDRKDFVKEEFQKLAYGDHPLPIGHGQTISQPTTVAIMLELLRPQKTNVVLDVGSGSGWTTALLASVCREGSVLGVEIIPELVGFGRGNLKKYKFKNADIIEAGEKLGFPTRAPYDKILVSAFAKKIPEELIVQLKVGGTMVIPIENSVFKITKKSETEIEKEEHFGFQFVPLVKK